MRVELIKDGEKITVTVQDGIKLTTEKDLKLSEALQIAGMALAGDFELPEEKPAKKEEKKVETVRERKEEGVPGKETPGEPGVSSDNVKGEQGTDRPGSVGKTQLQIDSGKKQHKSKPSRKGGAKKSE